MKRLGFIVYSLKSGGPDIQYGLVASQDNLAAQKVRIKRDSITVQVVRLESARHIPTQDKEL